jgi:hypothetical protein
LSDIKKDLTTTWDVTLKTSYPTFSDLKKIKLNVNILDECKESRDIYHLLRASIEDNIDKIINMLHQITHFMMMNSKA